MYPKWVSSLGRCKKNGNHPDEGLAKFGYKPPKSFPFLFHFKLFLFLMEFD
jgi:hypothetical protein